MNASGDRPAENISADQKAEEKSPASADAGASAGAGLAAKNRATRLSDAKRRGLAPFSPQVLMPRENWACIAFPQVLRIGVQDFVVADFLTVLKILRVKIPRPADQRRIYDLPVMIPILFQVEIGRKILPDYFLQHLWTLRCC
ncbi:MAG: hypothetical protein ACOYMT_04845 [Chthoniobacterales bacterium]